jgi:hypothetical protein
MQNAYQSDRIAEENIDSNLEATSEVNNETAVVDEDLPDFNKPNKLEVVPEWSDILAPRTRRADYQEKVIPAKPPPKVCSNIFARLYKLKMFAKKRHH